MCPGDGPNPTEEESSPGEFTDYELSGEQGGEHLEANDPFFVSKQAAAVFKHKFLKSYFPKFAGKAGSTEIDKRLVYVDTHAGRGEYSDGTPGSPLLIAQNVTGMTQRQIDCFFIERNRSNFRSLERVLKAAMPEDAVWVARQGQASKYLTESVAFAGNAPLFVFVDPYGLGPTFNEVVTVLKRPREGYGRKTEVLLNFISSAFSRAGGYLAHDEQNARAIVAEKGRIDVRAKAAHLFGDSFGLAWSKHLREALARLHDEGLMTPKPLSKGLEKYVGTRC